MRNFWLRLKWERAAMTISRKMIADGFKRSDEPCPYCHRRGARLVRFEEHVCLRCTYGRMWPSTREKFGWGDPIGGPMNLTQMFHR